MRLLDLGRATALACVGWLMQGPVLAQQSSDLSGVTTDRIVLSRANSFTEPSTARIQSALTDQLSDDSRFSHALSGRTHVALVAPSFVQHASPATLATPIATLSSTNAQKPPSVWLMGGVTLLLIGYQLRRKHRLLRPHRFNAL